MFSNRLRGLFGTGSKRERLYTYDTIPLKLFLDIANDGKYERLILKGKASLEQCLERWEEIIKINSTENASFQYQSYFSLVQGYSLLLAQHTIIKLLLTKSQIKVDYDALAELKERGYPIDLKNYSASIMNAFHKSNAMVTKINMKRSEIERQYAMKQSKSDSFVDIVASLEIALGDGRNIPEDITLAKYNAIKKSLKAKIQKQNSLQKQSHGRFR